MPTRDMNPQRVSPAVQSEATRLDHRVKVGVVVAGLATLAVFAWAGLREQVYTDWHRHQAEFKRLLAAKADTPLGKKLHQEFDYRIRQVVIPELGVVDRCISCHNGITDPRMTQVPNPHRVHPGDLLQKHEVGRFGCTLCHRGQGHALVFAEAKAVGYHWPYPLLPKGLTQAACGLCHGPEEVRDRDGEKYALGHAIFHRRGCVSCHKLSGRGGSLGPDLTREGWKAPQEVPMAKVRGEKTLPQWLREHFEEPQRLVPGSQMPPLRMTPGELDALTVFMLSLQGRDLPSGYLTPAKYLEIHQRLNPPEASGEALVDQYCGTCHDTGHYGRYDPFYRKFIPAIRGPSFVQLATPAFVDDAIRRGRPGSVMAAWAGGLSDPELVRIRDHLLSRPVPPEVRLPAAVVAQAKDPRLTLQGDAPRGAALFARQCASCHGPAGKGGLGPSLTSGVFQGSATDGFLYATIAYGRVDTAMPAFLGTHAGSYGEADIRALVSHLRALGGHRRPRAPGASPPRTRAPQGGTP